MADYNGWKNKATWSVALTINNNYNLYMGAVEFMKQNTEPNPYKKFVIETGLQFEKTAEGFGFKSQELDYEALNDMMKELV